MVLIRSVSPSRSVGTRPVEAHRCAYSRGGVGTRSRDGVDLAGDQPIPGAADAVARLQRTADPVAFVTNNSFTRRSAVIEKLERHGIDARDLVFTSAMAAASLLEPGSKALALCGPGVFEELELRESYAMDVSADGAERWGAIPSSWGSIAISITTA